MQMQTIYFLYNCKFSVGIPAEGALATAQEVPDLRTAKAHQPDAAPPPAVCILLVVQSSYTLILDKCIILKYLNLNIFYILKYINF